MQRLHEVWADADVVVWRIVPARDDVLAAPDGNDQRHRTQHDQDLERQANPPVVAEVPPGAITIALL